MRFVQFIKKSLKSASPQLGVQLTVEGDIYNLSGSDPSIPNSLVQFLSDNEDALEKAKRIVTATKSVVPLKEAELLAPITKPDKVACVGMNYSGHCAELKVEFPKEPVFFSKFSSVIIGPYDKIQRPATHISNMIDLEVELAIVIGKKAKAVTPEQANNYIFGYTVAQDITARDWLGEKNGGQYLLAKSIDTSCPLGPAVVPKEFVKDPNNLSIKSLLNGEPMQKGNTSEMIFKPHYIVSSLSQLVTLYPGDVILTGTPAGIGANKNPPRFLQRGDLVESEIEEIGRMKNEVV